MAKIEGFRVKNYRVLQDVTIGRLWSAQKSKPMSAITAVVGRNGAGKSTLFDVFGFLADALKLGVEEACDRRGRGGFERLRSLGTRDPIEFEIYYKESRNSRPITYELHIDADRSGRPFVCYERLRQRRRGQRHGRPFSFLILHKGKGFVWTGDSVGTHSEDPSLDALSEEDNTREEVELDDYRRLGITTLGALKQNPRIIAFRRFIEGWYLSYFTPDAARSLPLAGPQRRLSTHGDNLGNVVQFMEREYPKKLKQILTRIAEKIPGIYKIESEKTKDGRLLLKFNDHAFTDPFFAQQMSDGTLKIFAYLLLLEDPDPPPFLCIEEPENGLYHDLLLTLASELREHATGKNACQVFLTTHQPYLVDALSPDEIWILERGSNGFSTVRRASEIPLVVDLVAEGLPLGGLWSSDYLDREQADAP